MATATPRSGSGNRIKSGWALGCRLFVAVSLPSQRPESAQTSSGGGNSNSFPQPGTSKSFSRESLNSRVRPRQWDCGS